MPGWCSGHFFLNFALTVVVAVLKVQTIGFIILPLLILDGRSDGIVGIVLLILNRDRECIRFDFVIDLIWYYMHFIQYSLEVALHLMLTVLAT